MPNQSLTIDQVLMILAATPPGIAALTARLRPAQTHTSPGHGEWSANEVLAHLRSCADVWGDCIVAIITRDEPTLRAINPRTWIEHTDYLEQEFGRSLRAFARQRKHLLKVLGPLPPQAWSRSATVTGAGKPLERTMLFYGQWLAGHERTHLRQIERIANTLRR